MAQKVPLSYIEWIYDLYGAETNPLADDTGIQTLKSLIREKGVAVRALCADYFMDLPFVRCSSAECEQREELLHRLISRAKLVGITRIVLPFVDASRIESAADRETVVRVILNALPIAREYGVELHLETALGPADFASLFEQIPNPLVKVNYDSGNSSSLGYWPGDEFAAYGERVGSVHIKDRVRGGGTVPLGQGDADFPALFSELAKIGYSGDITLQVARPEAGCEVEWAKRNLAFVSHYWPVG